MKLHLPTRLRAAVLACFAVVTSFSTTLATGALTGGAFAITLAAVAATQQASAMTSSVTDTARTFTTGQDYSQGGISYNASTGVITGAVTSDMTFDLNLAAITAAADLIRVGSDSVTWGFRVTADKGITGLWKNGDVRDWTSGGTVPASTLAGLATDNVVRLTAYINNDGTALNDGDTISFGNADINATNPGEADNLYRKYGLKSSTVYPGTVTINKDLITTLYLIDRATTYTADGHSITHTEWNHVNATTALKEYSQSDEEDWPSLHANHKPVYVGGSGLLRFTTSNKNISLDSDIYVGSSTHADAASRGVIDINNGARVTLSGSIYVVEDTSIGSRNNGAINLSGTITDKRYIDNTVSTGGKTLTIKGNGYNISGNVDVTKVNLTGATVSMSGAASSIAELSADANSSLSLTGGNLSIIGTSSILGTLNVTAANALTVAQGGSLTLGSKLNVSSPALGDTAFVDGAGSIVVNSDIIVELGADFTPVENKEYKIFADTLTLEGWDALSQASFRQNGLAVSSRTEIELTEYGFKFTKIGAVYSDMSTTGEHDWNYTDAIWNTAQDAVDTPIAFVAGDSAVFSADADLTITEAEIQAAAVTVNEGATLTLTGNGNKLNCAAISLSGNLKLKDKALANSSRVTGTGTLIIGGEVLFDENNIFSGYTGNIEVANGGVLKAGVGVGNGGGILGTDYRNEAGRTRTITVKDGGAVDINGTGDFYYKVVLEGNATYKNTGANVTSNARQLPELVLVGNAKVDTSTMLGMMGSSGDPTKLSLQNHTLTKTGTGTFFLNRTTADAGTIQVDAGIVQVQGAGNYTGTTFVVGSGATLTSSDGAQTNTVYTLNGGTTTLSGGTYNGAGITVGSGATLTSSGGTQTNTVYTLNGGTTTLSGGTYNGAGITVGSGATLTISGGTFSGATITHNGGNVFNSTSATLGATVNVGSGSTFQANGGTYTDTVVNLAGGATMNYRTAGNHSFKALNTTGDATLSSAQNASYTMTVTGASVASGKLTKNNAGHVAFVGTADLQGGLDIQGGSVRFNNTATIAGVSMSNGTALYLDQDAEVTISGTSSVKNLTLAAPLTNTGNLTLSGTLTADLAGFTAVPGSSGNLSYVDADGNAAVSGYLSGNRVYTLIDNKNGGTLNDDAITSVAGADGTYADGKLTVSSTDWTIFYVNADDDPDTNDEVTAENLGTTTGGVAKKYSMNGGTLILTDTLGDKLDDVLLATVGDTGTIALHASVTLGNGSVTQSKADVEVASGKKFSLGASAGGGSTTNAAVSIESLNSVILNGGTLFVRGVPGKLGTIVSKLDSTGSKLQIHDMQYASDRVAIDSLVLNADLDVHCNWKSNIDIASMQGSGAMNVQHYFRADNGNRDDCGDTVYLNIDSLKGYSGSINMIGGNGKDADLRVDISSGTTAVSMGGMSYTDSSLTFHVEANTTLSESLALVGKSDTNISVDAGTTLTAPISFALNNGATGNITLAGDAILNSTMSVNGSAVNITGGSVNGSVVVSGNSTINVDGGSWSGDIKLNDAAALTTALTTTGDLSVGGSATLTVAADKTVAVGGSVKADGAGTLIKEGAGTLTIGGTTEVLGNLNAQNGTVNLLATELSIGTTGEVGNKKGLYVKGATAVNIGDGISASKVTVNRLEMGDNASGDGGTLNLKSLSTLIVTGGDVDASYHNTGLIVSEYWTSSTLNIEGKLLSQNASVTYGDWDGTINVKSGGMLATKGFIHHTNKSAGSRLNLTLEDGGTIIVGANGMQANALVTTLGAGTISMTEDSSMTKNATLSSTSGTVFDTTKYVWGADGTSITQGTEGGIFTVSGVLSGAGKLKVTGAGTLVLTADNTYSGGTLLQGGTLQVSKEAALGAGALSMTGGVLDVTANVTLGTNVATTVTGGKLKASGAEGWVLSGASVGGAAGDSTGAGIVTLEGATITDAIDGNGKLALSGTTSATQDVTLTDMLVGGASVSGDHTITLADTTVTGDVTGNGKLVLSGGLSATTDATVSGVSAGGNTVAADSAGIVTLEGATITDAIDGNGKLALSGTTSATQDVTLTDILVGGASVSGDHTITLADTTVTGDVTGNGKLVLSGGLTATTDATVSGVSAGGNTVATDSTGTLTLEDATLTGNMTGNDKLVLAGTVNTAANATVTGADVAAGTVFGSNSAELTLKDMTHDAAFTNSGTMKLEGGTVSANLTNTGMMLLNGTTVSESFTNAAGGNLQLEDTTLGAVINNAEINMSLSGTQNVTLAGTSTKKYADVYGSVTYGDNGFMSTMDTYGLVSGTAATADSGTIWQLNGTEVKTEGLTTVNFNGNDLIVLKGDAAGKVYYVNSGDVEYADGKGIAAAEKIQLEGGTLKLTADLNTAVTDQGIVVTGTGTRMVLNSTLAADALSIAGGTVSLSGTGTLEIGAALLAERSGLELVDTAWTGKALVAGATLSNADLSDLGVSGSTIELRGTSGTLKGGDYTAAVKLTSNSAISLGAGNSFDTLDATGGTLSITGAGNTITTLTMADDAKLTLDFTATGVTDLKNWSEGPMLTVDTLKLDTATSGGKLTVDALTSDAALLTLANGDTKVLATFTNCAADLDLDVLLNGQEEVFATGGADGMEYKYTLETDDTTGVVNIVIKAVNKNEGWVAQDTDPDSLADTTWTDADVIGDGKWVGVVGEFYGGGNATVNVEADGVTADNVVVSASTGVTEYTFTGGTLTTDVLVVNKGGLVLDNDGVNANQSVILSNDGKLTVNSELTVGTEQEQGQGMMAGANAMVLGEAELDNRGETTIHGTLSVADTATVTNSGTLTVDALDAAGATIDNTATLITNGGGMIGALTGEGTLENGGMLIIESDTTLAALTNKGTLTVDGKLTVNSDITIGGTVSAGSAELASGSFDTLVVTGAVKAADLTVTNGELGSLEATGLTVNTDGTVKVNGDTTLNNLSNGGTLSVTGKLDVEKDIALGGTVSAGSAELASGSFDTLVVTGAVKATDLTVTNAELGSLVATGLTVNTDGTVKVNGDTTLKSLSNGGTLVVTGKLDVENNIALGGKVSAGSAELASGSFDTLKVTNSVTATDLTVTNAELGSLEATGLTVNTDGTVKVNGDTTLKSLSNGGTLSVTGKLDVEKDIALGGKVGAGSAELASGSFDTLVVTGAVKATDLSVKNLSADSLTADSLTVTNGELGSLNTSALTVNTDGSVKVNSDTTLESLSNGGTLVVTGKLDVEKDIALGGKVSADSAELASGSFDTLAVTGAVTAADLSVKNLSADSLTADSLTVNGGLAEVNSAVALQKYSSTGTAVIAGDLTVGSAVTSGGTVKADNISIAGAADFAAVTTGKLTADAVALGKGSLTTLATDKLVVKGGAVQVTDAVKLTALSGEGSLTTGGSLSLTNAAEGSVSVQATELLLGSTGNTMGSVSTDAITLMGDCTLSTTDALLTVDGITALGADPIDVTVTDKAFDALEIAADGSYAAADYLLVDGATDAALFNYVNAEEHYDAIRYTGKAVGLMVKDGVLSLSISEVTDADGNVTGNIWDTTDGNTTTTNGYDVPVDTADFYTALDYVSGVVVKGNTSFDLSDTEVGDSLPGNATHPEAGLLVRNLVGGGTLSIVGDGTSQDAVSIFSTPAGIEGEAVKVVVDGATLNLGLPTGVSGVMDEDAEATGARLARLMVKNGSRVDVFADSVVEGATDLEDFTRLIVADGATLESGQLLGGNEAEIGGRITVTKGGYYTGQYDDAIIATTDGADMTLLVGGRRGLTVAAGGGTVKLLSAGQEGRVEALRVGPNPLARGTAGATTLVLDNTTLRKDGSVAHHMTTVAAEEGNFINKSTVMLSLGAMETARTLNTTANPVVLDGVMGVTDSKVKVNMIGAASAEGVLDVNTASDRNLTLARLTMAGGSISGNTVELTGTSEMMALVNKYYTNARLDSNGAIKVDRVTDFYSSAVRGLSENGKAGISLADAALVKLNPQADREKYGDLAKVLDTLDHVVSTGDSETADQLGSSVAGASVAALGAALAGDMERQLRAIRNRTTTMGVDQTAVNQEMPYFNAWINAEGDLRRLDQETTAAGYDLTSWGGTVGFDVDVTPQLTFGLAVTSMWGDFTAKGCELAEGDMQSNYVSAFARYGARRWVHTFVASVGMSETSLERTVNHAGGSYSTEGVADGVSYGFLYEVGYVFAANEEGTACLQPVVNVMLSHNSLSGFDESGSSAALRTSDVDMTTMTIGAGVRAQAVMGENLYNRASIVEARALLKLRSGDRTAEAENSLLAVPAAAASVKAAEMGTMSCELGVGITVPVGADGSSIFADASVDVGGGYTDFNGTVGYRINF